MSHPGHTRGARILACPPFVATSIARAIVPVERRGAMVVAEICPVTNVPGSVACDTRRSMVFPSPHSLFCSSMVLGW